MVCAGAELTGPLLSGDAAGSAPRRGATVERTGSDATLTGSGIMELRSARVAVRSPTEATRGVMVPSMAAIGFAPSVVRLESAAVRLPSTSVSPPARTAAEEVEVVPVPVTAGGGVMTVIGSDGFEPSVLELVVIVDTGAATIGVAWRIGLTAAAKVAAPLCVLVLEIVLLTAAATLAGAAVAAEKTEWKAALADWASGTSSTVGGHRVGRCRRQGEVATQSSEEGADRGADQATGADQRGRAVAGEARYGLG